MTSTVGPCTSTELATAVVNRAGFAFHQVNVIGLTNTSTNTCTLHGYPKVRTYGPSGNLLNAKIDEASSAVAYSNIDPSVVVTLSPKQTAGLYIAKMGNPDGNGSCPPVSNAYVAITLASGSGPALKVPIEIGLCNGGTVYVSPFTTSTTIPNK